MRYSKISSCGLFMAFFFGSGDITPRPVDITQNWTEFRLKPPLSAANSGASLYIDITSMVGHNGDVNYLDSRFPDKTIEAVLIDSTGKQWTFVNGSAYAINDDETTIKMLYPGEVPTNRKFTLLRIRSRILLKRVKLYWKNFAL